MGTITELSKAIQQEQPTQQQGRRHLWYKQVKEFFKSDLTCIWTQRDLVELLRITEGNISYILEQLIKHGEIIRFEIEEVDIRQGQSKYMYQGC